jgi:hypothetical protein
MLTANPPGITQVSVALVIEIRVPPESAVVSVVMLITPVRGYRPHTGCLIQPWAEDALCTRVFREDPGSGSGPDNRLQNRRAASATPDPSRLGDGLRW